MKNPYLLILREAARDVPKRGQFKFPNRTKNYRPCRPDLGGEYFEVIRTVDLKKEERAQRSRELGHPVWKWIHHIGRIRCFEGRVVCTNGWTQTRYKIDLSEPAALEKLRTWLSRNAGKHSTLDLEEKGRR